MAKPDDGGSAFPHTADSEYDGRLGMSLRQWYAGQFASHYPVHISLEGISDEAAEGLAIASFKFADAMIRIGKEGA